MPRGRYATPWATGIKRTLRLALPPLADIAPQSVMAFALFGRGGDLLRSGELPLEELARAVPVDRVEAILHPHDAVVVTAQVPPVPARLLESAVQGSVESLALSDTAELCIAHGPRAADGSICIAWAGRQALLDAWARLADAGLRLAAIVPHALALPDGDPHPERALALPADARWRADLPRWSLARPEWRPVPSTHRWRGAALWAGAAALLWLLGLNLYAAQLRGEARSVQAAMEQAVRQAFPSIGIVIDPVRQARNMRRQLRLAGGAASEDGFMPLALGAADVLGFAAGHVASLRYEQGVLTLVLAEGYAPPANEAALRQAAAVRSLQLRRDDDAAHIWHVRQAGVAETTGGRP